MKREKSRVIIIIPARYSSSRFPGKPLAEIDKLPMIQHVYERAKKTKYHDEVIVATDDMRIFEAVRKFDGKVVMTKVDHQSGTDRVAEVAQDREADIIVNVQGDEPLINPSAIDQAIEPLVEDEHLAMSSLMTRIRNEEECSDSNIVKVVVDQQNNALYFSRSCIPYPRHKEGLQIYKHVGIYVYRKDFLLRLSAMEQTPLERTESLEQLRVLENGFRIRMVNTNYESISVDTPEDLEYIHSILTAKNRRDN
ncbi:MAG: 3-deoxy-manno-octulosonate cytidylyltransferase [bacterium]